MREKIFDSKINLVIVASLFLLMILGCQPPGGELLPIGGEGIEIATSRFENDTAVISENGVKMKFYGSWDGRANIRMVVENSTPNSIKINFNEFAILDSKGKGENIDLISEVRNNAAKEISNKQYLIAPAGKHKFLIGFPLNLMSSLDEEPPQIISVLLAIEVNSKTKELRKYKVDFKGIRKKDLSGRSDPTDW
jgi:hypothetical protein